MTSRPVQYVYRKLPGYIGTEVPCIDGKGQDNSAIPLGMRNYSPIKQVRGFSCRLELANVTVQRKKVKQLTVMACLAPMKCVIHLAHRT